MARVSWFQLELCIPKRVNVQRSSYTTLGDTEDQYDPNCADSHAGTASTTSVATSNILPTTALS